MTFIDSVKILLIIATHFGVIPFRYNSQLNIFEVKSYQILKCIIVILCVLSYDFVITLTNILLEVEFIDKTDQLEKSTVTKYSEYVPWLIQAISCTICSCEFVFHFKSFVNVLNTLLDVETYVRCYYNDILDYRLLKYSIAWDFFAIALDLCHNMMSIVFWNKMSKQPTVYQIISFLIEKYFAAFGLSFLQIIILFVVILLRGLRRISSKIKISNNDGGIGLNAKAINRSLKIIDHEFELQNVVKTISKISFATLMTVSCLLFIGLTRNLYTLILNFSQNFYKILWAFSVIAAYIKLLLVCECCADEVRRN